MKRGKCEGKTLGPMFPRLHVNDTERGGPRAPPRNKMALYEQLTIPSNRYNPGNMHLNPNSGSSLVPVGSSSQDTSRERAKYFPLYQPAVAPPLPSHSADRLQRQPSNVVNLRSSASQVEQKRNPEDEDDFAVPIFSHPGQEQCNGAHQSINHNEEELRGSSSCSVRLPNAYNKGTNEVQNGNLRQDGEGQDGNPTTVFVSSSDPAIKYSANVSAPESSDGAIQLQEDALMGGHLDMNKASRSNNTNVDSRYSDSKSCGPINGADGRISLRLKSNSNLGLSNRNELDYQDEGNSRDDTLPRENMDRGDDVSQTSIVATISDLDISPDDVVDIIGLKHFFKARRAIANQQRIFAVQVFELHRLIKVQKLIAKSPEVLLEASAFLGKSPMNAAPLKKIPSDYAVKVLADAEKQKDDSQTPNHNNKIEGAAEHAVAKPPIASLDGAAEHAVVKPPTASPPTPTQPLTHQPFSVNPSLGSHTMAIAPAPAAAPPAATDSKAIPWPFPQAGGHQWLVPVMSPSEGLIYKPYTGPGFQGPVCGGCGPQGTTSLVGHFINPSYGVPPSHYYHHHQGVPFSSQGYFPAYGMPMMSSFVSGSAVDQINWLTRSNPNGETGQMVGGMSGSCNIPSQRHSELLGSTGSSPSDRAQDIVGAGRTTKEKDAFTLSPTAPFKSTRTREADLPTMVIKVVPHNGRTATESAARIFRSIQEERRQQSN